MDVAIIGLGWVGLTSAAAVSSRGHTVVGYDINETRVEQLCDRQVPFHEPGLADALDGVQFTTDPDRDIHWADITLICVNTPSLPDGSADLSFLDSAVDLAGRHARRASTIVIRSTVPVGTGDRIAARLPNHVVVSNPEFLREGCALQDALSPQRVVIGSDLPDPADVIALYPDDAPVLIMSRPSAEMTKMASNAYLATRVSFINLIAQACEALGGDVEDVRLGMGLDERIGTEFLSPGLGYGGSCFPKDVASLYYQCDEAGVVGAGLLEEVEIQNKMAVQRARDTVRGVPFPARRIAVLGRAFKPGTSDTRDSQAVRLADELMADGYDVVVHDPEADPGPYESAPSVMNAVFGADLVVIATAWPEYLKVNWLLAAAYMNRCWMYDPWNFIGPETARDAGMHYIGTGGHE